MYTSEQILDMEDLYTIAENAGNLIPVKYELTDAERGWLDFVSGRYAVADWVGENLEGDVLTIESYGLSEALDADCHGYGKAVMLSDDTALQRIFFWCYTDAQ